MPKKKISLTLGSKEVENLKKILPFSSALVSAILSEFFKSVSTEEIWSVLEMGRSLSFEERVRRLEGFIRQRVTISSSSPREERKLSEENAWERFGK